MVRILSWMDISRPNISQFQSVNIRRSAKFMLWALEMVQSSVRCSSALFAHQHIKAQPWTRQSSIRVEFGILSLPASGGSSPDIYCNASSWGWRRGHCSLRGRPQQARQLSLEVKKKVLGEGKGFLAGRKMFHFRHLCLMFRFFYLNICGHRRILTMRNLKSRGLNLSHTESTTPRLHGSKRSRRITLVIS